MKPRMSRVVGLLGLILTGALVTVATGAELPETVFAPVSGDAIQDVLFLADARPVFVRFHIRVGAEGFRTVWTGFAGRLHRFLDTDSDGVLTLEEAQRGNWQQLIQAGLAARLAAQGPALNSAALDSQPRDGTVSTSEMAHYLRSTLGYGEFGLQPGLPLDPKALALFAHLDSDHDGTLSAAELAPGATDACFARLDRDEDELLSLAEMRPFENLYGERFRRTQVVANAGGGDTIQGPFVPLGFGAGADGARLVERLTGKYDRGTTTSPKDGHLDCAELGRAAETVRRFDTDGDGGLNAAELTVWLTHPVPDTELSVALEPGGSKPATIAIAGGGGSAATPETATRPVHLTLDGVAFELAIEENLLTARVALDRQFEAADADKNGYLDKSEATEFRFIQQAFEVIDRDHDGKLYMAELKAYMDRQSEALASRVMLTIGDRGRSLFDMLDSDSDHKLGLRELRRAAALLASLDRDGDGRIARSEIPHQYRLAIGRGRAAVRPPGLDPYERLETPVGRGGSAWFEKMDRNRDGDISRREFLGTREQFSRLDADGDGLIDPREAGGKE